MIKVAVIFNRLGPYHHARLTAAGTRCQLAAIEVLAMDSTYAWDAVPGSGSFTRLTLFQDTGGEVKSSEEHYRRIKSVLAELRPDVVFVPGWSDRSALAAIYHCRQNSIPVVIMSDSQEHDEPRTWMKESIKKRIVGLCQAGLVAGSTHADYLARLGMPRTRICTGYDVVDNQYFHTRSQVVRRDCAVLRKMHHLPERFFLASNRFVEKKNLPRLIQAFARYLQHSTSNGWKLVILGDGELRPILEGLQAEYGVTGKVLLPGFKQYPELPVYYGLASAFIHSSTTEQWGLVVNEAMASGLPVLVSNRCGCAPDLVQEGVNGYTFDPYDVDAMTGLMARIASVEVDRVAMGAASQEIISRWTPETFADNLLRSAEAALAAPEGRTGTLDNLLLKGLMNR